MTFPVNLSIILTTNAIWYELQTASLSKQQIITAFLNANDSLIPFSGTGPLNNTEWFYKHCEFKHAGLRPDFKIQANLRRWIIWNFSYILRRLELNNEAQNVSVVHYCCLLWIMKFLRFNSYIWTSFSGSIKPTSHVKRRHFTFHIQIFPSRIKEQVKQIILDSL